MSRYTPFTLALIAASITLLASPLRPEGFSISEPPKNLGLPVNSATNDFAPAISPDGGSIIFNSKRNGRDQDLFISYNKNGEWSEPEPLAVLNSPYNDEAPFISADGATLLFSSDRDGSVEMPKNELGQVRVSFDLYWSKMTEAGWSAPVPVPGAVNTMYHEKTPALSRDGATLYYATWVFGDMHRTVLAQAVLREGAFVDPRPMPAPFNTGYQDVALIPADDLGGFFFASNRPGGIGKFDLWFVSFKDGSFGAPVNPGPLLNSPENEIFLARADQRYFICSSRAGGNGLFDLYSSYVFKKEASFETRAIHFDFDQAVILKESYPYLDALATFLKENDKVGIEIIGHTDLHGTDEYNNQLSLRRAEAVKKYLAARGLDQARMKITGAGKSRPVKNREGKGFDELNRRTEFRLIQSR